MARRQVFPRGPSLDLWPRVWNWAEFFNTYWDHLPNLDEVGKSFLRVAICSLLLKLREDPETGRIMAATRGVRRAMAAGWATMVRHHTLPAPPAALGELAMPLFALSEVEEDVTDPRNIEEVVEGCGGSYGDFASVLTQYLSHAAPDAKSQMAVGALTPALTYLQLTLNNDDFNSALLSNGIIPALVSSLAIDGEPPLGGLSHRPVDLCFMTLVEYLQVPPGLPWIPQALEAGLLRYVVSFGEKMAQPSEKGMYPALKALLTTILPSSLVSYAVITQMKKSFAAVELASQSREFVQSALFGDWTVFRRLVKERVAVLDAWESSGRVSFLACDNMKCGKIEKREMFRCCSACQTANYCSAKCQRVDWLDAHREVCAALKSYNLVFHVPGLKARDRAFMRELLHVDYRRLQIKISLEVLRFMRNHPDQAFFVYLDYTGAGGVRFEVHAETEYTDQDYLAAQWERQRRSGGRMTMHVMHVGLGRRYYQLVFPLRATTPRLLDGLRRIASNMHTLQPSQVEALLGALVQTADQEGLEIH
ncbi:hypothetical protein DFH06DRAFT_1131271 [Mycena polygramma]|nr:hypothetical protein DFH06DRAFT_1131271 [Mycena polygramma]